MHECVWAQAPWASLGLATALASAAAWIRCNASYNWWGSTWGRNGTRKRKRGAAGSHPDPPEEDHVQFDGAGGMEEDAETEQEQWRESIGEEGGERVLASSVGRPRPEGGSTPELLDQAVEQPLRDERCEEGPKRRRLDDGDCEKRQDGNVFVVTGLFPEVNSHAGHAHAQIKAVIESLGGTVLKGITKFPETATHLLVGDRVDEKVIEDAQKIPWVSIVHLQCLQPLLLLPGQVQNWRERDLLQQQKIAELEEARRAEEAKAKPRKEKAKAKPRTLIATAQANLVAELGLAMLYSIDPCLVWAAIVYLESVRDQPDGVGFPTLPEAIRNFFALSWDQAKRMAIIDFDSNQRLLQKERGGNLGVSGNELFDMSRTEMWRRVDAFLDAKYRRQKGERREPKYLYERVVRFITLRWCQQQLHWMAKSFYARKCCLLPKLVDGVAYQVAHFLGPKPGDLVPRMICPGAKTKYYNDGCISALPMAFISTLFVCFSIPSLFNTDSPSAGSYLRKDKYDEAVLKAHTGVTVDDQRIVRQLKATKADRRGDGLTMFNYAVPRAEGDASVDAAKPDCNCSVCKGDRNQKSYTQSQHRCIRCLADYHGVMEDFDHFSLERMLAELSVDKTAMDAFVKKIVEQMQCDTDHLVGRSHELYNSLYTTFPCSHSMNTKLAYLRHFVGDWCYGLGTLKYTHGNV